MFRGCPADHSVCACCWDRRSHPAWFAAVAALNAGGIVWHAVWDRRLVLDHVQRSWRFYNHNQ
jgi:hypothetical protein